MEYLRLLKKCLCCFHCTESTNIQLYSDERTHLLSDTLSNNTPALRSTNLDNQSSEFPQSLPKKHEQNVLCCLVQNTNTNMIDVGAMDLHNVEHQEYNARIRLYSHRLQQQWNKVQHPGKYITGFLKDLPNPVFNLSNKTLRSDILQIKDAVKLSRMALEELKIDYKEAIVVPFRIP